MLYFLFHLVICEGRCEHFSKKLGISWLKVKQEYCKQRHGPVMQWKEKC